jgi:hypothetical protein
MWLPCGLLPSGLLNRSLYITVPSFLVTTLLVLEGAEAEYEQIRGGGGGAKFYWAQGRKVPKYRPADSILSSLSVSNLSEDTTKIHRLHDDL